VSSESNFSFTTKINGNDLFTVRGDTYDEFLSHLVTAGSVAGVKVLLSALDGDETGAYTPVPGMKEAVNVVQSVFPGSTVVDPFAPIAPAVVSQPAVDSSDKSCSHGVMIKRTGNGAKGEWRAFFCPTPKDTPGQCTPIFAKRGTGEWNSF
jgi:hypothetical protein